MVSSVRLDIENPLRVVIMGLTTTVAQISTKYFVVLSLETEVYNTALPGL